MLSTEARVALTLRLLGVLTTEEIARAFLVKEATVAQRIVGAKRGLAEARVPFEVPAGTSSQTVCRRCSLGPYALQGAIVACHARARTPEETDWARSAAIYDALARSRRPPVVERIVRSRLQNGLRPAGGPRDRR